MKYLSLFTSVLFIGFLSYHPSLSAQSESELKKALEGKRVEVLLDMPASSEGVDLRMDDDRILDFDLYSRRIKDYGVSIYTEDVVMITKVKKKKKHIEFQLAGGGFGTFNDENTFVSSEYIEKSSREKELEELVKDKSKSSSELSKLKNELSDLRNKREREQNRVDREVEQEREMKSARISDKRLQGGSRFNIRYSYNIGSRELDIETLKKALSEYVNFENVGSSPSTSITERPVSTQSGFAKGMTMEDAVAAMGLPSQMNSTTACQLEQTTCTFEKDDQIIEAIFVEKVLVKYTISSN